jgi:hypothetical protein
MAIRLAWTSLFIASSALNGAEAIRFLVIVCLLCVSVPLCLGALHFKIGLRATLALRPHVHLI